MPSLLLLPFRWEWNCETPPGPEGGLLGHGSWASHGTSLGRARIGNKCTQNAKHVSHPDLKEREDVSPRVLCVYVTLCLHRNPRFLRTSPYYSAAPTAQRVWALALRGEDFPELSAQGGSQTASAVTLPRVAVTGSLKLPKIMPFTQTLVFQILEIF